jgi:hypothetical protein
MMLPISQRRFMPCRRSICSSRRRAIISTPVAKTTMPAHGHTGGPSPLVRDSAVHKNVVGNWGRYYGAAESRLNAKPANQLDPLALPKRETEAAEREMPFRRHRRLDESRLDAHSQALRPCHRRRKSKNRENNIKGMASRVARKRVDKGLASLR